MILASHVLVLASLLTMIQSDCSDFGRQWKPCSLEMFPSSAIANAFCTYKINTSAKVIIVDNKGKTAAIYCHNDTFPENLFQCLPFGHTKHLILSDCPFPQNSFDKFFSNTNLSELSVRYTNSHIVQTSLRLRDLPLIQFLSLKNVPTFFYFELLLNSVPLMKSIKISNTTFTSLPAKPFQELSQLKGLTLTNGILEVLPDDFLLGTNLQSLDLSMNKLNTFQPNLIKDMRDLKKLLLSHNLLETIDENLFNDAISLKVLSLQHNRIRSLPVALFKTSSNISYLDISHNALGVIPDNIFKGLKRVQYLKLSHNHLRVLPPNIFNDMKELVLLELQSNQLHFLENLLTSENVLNKIDLSNNKISRIASSAPFGKSRNLENVNISNNHLEEFINLDWSLYNIKQLDLNGNSIRELTLPTPARPEGLISLQNNKIRRVIITQNLTMNYRYLLSGNPFDCNCDFSDFLSHSLVVVDADKLTCQEPWHLANKSLIYFQNKSKVYEINKDCPLECKCRLLPNNKIEVYCNNTGIKSAAISLPFQATILHLENNEINTLSDIDEEMWENLTHLYLSNNSLTTLENWSIPSELKLLAVDGNNLLDLPSSLMERIRESEDFSVYLKGNNWPCDCQIISLKKWMMENLHKVKDSQRIYCKSHNNDKFRSPIAQIPLEEFVCSEAQHSNQLSNSGVNLEIHISVSVTFCSLLSIANKMY